jgi:tripartite-type tricarboxylate transporter receptor subunit TctC
MTRAMKHLCAIALLLGASHAFGQAYPSRPLLLIVPLQAGTAVDTVARIIGQKMSESMGRPVVVENQPGAAGMIGTERIARAAPDGYTIGFVNDSILTMLPNLNAKLPYDPLRDLAPVSRVAGNAFGIGVLPDFAAKNLPELIAMAKAKPGGINFGSGGSGSPQHVVMEMLKAAAGIDLTHVPYKGAAQALNDALGGQVQIIPQGLGVLNSYVKSGKLRLLATTGANRSPLLPEVPTAREAGLAGFEFATWFALVAPAGTPRAVIERLNAEVLRAANLPEVRERLIAQGYEIYASSPEQAAEATRDGLARMAKIIRDAGIRPE